jgi:pimeloyl-ACP methyl ester carboxylesterase
MYVDREGVRIWYEVRGEGERAFLLVPGYQIIRGTGLYKYQVPFLARHGRVVVFDHRGSGRSDRPREGYAVAEYVADLGAVADAAGLERFALVGFSLGAELAVRYAAAHPDRLTHLVLISPALARFFGESPIGVRNRLANLPYPLFVREFMERCFPEPFSGKARDDGARYGRELTPEENARCRAVRGPESPIETALAAVHVPALVLHGEADGIVPVAGGRWIAASMPGARFQVLPDCGHAPVLRFPVRTNLAIRDFCRTAGHAPAGGRARPGAPRALFLSSPIGLGHVKRDLAIARALRERVPGLEIEWLTAEPSLSLLERAGERVRPESRRLRSESAHVESFAGEHELPIFQAFREMDEVLVANFHTFYEIVEREGHDLWIGDEAWDLDYHLHENPELKRNARYVFLTDFVGFLPVTSDPSRHEFWQCYERNAEWIRHREARPGVCDLSIFLGDEEDLPAEPFGPGLASIRDWTRARFYLSGYVDYAAPGAFADRERLRAELGLPLRVPLVVATSGGTAAGRYLLEKTARAFAIVKRRLPEARLVLIAGGRIPADALAAAAPPGGGPAGVEVRGFEAELEKLLGACDLAVVHGGLGTTMELAMIGRRFLYFPLALHFEQQLHVPRRLARHRAGRKLDYAATGETALAEAIVSELAGGRDPEPLRPAPGAARRVADAIAGVLERR